MARMTGALTVWPLTVSGGRKRAPTVFGGLNGFFGFRILMPHELGPDFGGMTRLRGGRCAGGPKPQRNLQNVADHQAEGW